jgi:hypothetical protein
MNLIQKNLNSCYCCLNSTQHTKINALAWYAVISTELLIDLFVNSPNRELVVPLGQQLFLTDQLIEQGAQL